MDGRRRGILEFRIVAGGQTARQLCLLLPRCAVVRVVFVDDVAGQGAGLRQIAHQRRNCATVPLHADLPRRNIERTVSKEYFSDIPFFKTVYGILYFIYEKVTCKLMLKSKTGSNNDNNNLGCFFIAF